MKLYKENEINNSYFYYTKEIDISDYTVDGMNQVGIFLEINGRTYAFKNPLNINDSNYKYFKSTYETTINISK